MKEFVSAGIQEALRTRLIAAVTEVCRDETFYVEKFRVEGTLCIVSDRNTFFVFQITELVGSKASEDASPQKNSSSSESDQHDSSQSRNNSHMWLDETDRSDSIEADQNANLADFHINQNFTPGSDKGNQLTNNTSVSASQFTLPTPSGSASRKTPVSRPNTRHRRKISYNENSENGSNADMNGAPEGELLQTIKQELPDFALEDSMVTNIRGSAGDNLLKMSTGVDLSSFGLDDNVKNKRRPYKARGGINSYAFSGRCYEEIYVRTPHGLYRYMCRLCNSMFKIRNGLYEHLNGHFGRRPHACRQCDARFAHHSSLHNHVRNKHSLQTEEEKQAALRHCCHTCGRRFRYPSELERHKAVHDEFPVNPNSAGAFGHGILAEAAGIEVAQQMSSANVASSSCQLQQDSANHFEFQIIDPLAAFETLQNGDNGRIDVGTS